MKQSASASVALARPPAFHSASEHAGSGPAARGPLPLRDFFRYHGIWAPGLRLFRAMGFRAKAFTIALTFMLPMALLSYNFFSGQAAQIGFSVVQQAGSTIDEIVGTSQRVRELLSEVEVGAREQTLGVAQTTKAVQDLDTVTQQNAALVEQTAAAAGALKDRAQGLAGEVAQFRLPDHVALGTN